METAIITIEIIIEMITTIIMESQIMRTNTLIIKIEDTAEIGGSRDTVQHPTVHTSTTTIQRINR